MKTIIASIIILLFAATAYAIDVTFTIPNNKVDRIKTPLFTEYPKTTFCPPRSPTSTPCVANPTDLQHFKSIVIKIMKDKIEKLDAKQIEKDGNIARKNYMRDNRPTDYEDLFQ